MLVDFCFLIFAFCFLVFCLFFVVLWRGAGVVNVDQSINQYETVDSLQLSDVYLVALPNSAEILVVAVLKSVRLRRDVTRCSL